MKEDDFCCIIEVSGNFNAMEAPIQGCGEDFNAFMYKTKGRYHWREEFFSVEVTRNFNIR